LDSAGLIQSLKRKARNYSSSGSHINNQNQLNLNKDLPILNIRGGNMTSEWIIVKSKIKEMVGTINVSADFNDELNKKVKQMIQDAVKRAEANGRKTVMGRDI
jgi:histone H3/H4